MCSTSIYWNFFFSPQCFLLWLGDLFQSELVWVHRSWKLNGFSIDRTHQFSTMSWQIFNFIIFKWIGSAALKRRFWNGLDKSKITTLWLFSRNKSPRTRANSKEKKNLNNFNYFWHKMFHIYSVEEFWSFFLFVSFTPFQVYEALLIIVYIFS